MGGRGSGNWYRWSKKSTTGDLLKLNISRLVKDGVISPDQWCSGSWQWTRGGEQVGSIGYEVDTRGAPWMRLHYTHAKTESMDYRVQLTTTRPHYGGVRWWFICPVVRCGRRVGALYGGKVFACRHCHQLAYPSQNKAAFDRHCDKAFELADKMDHIGNVFDGFYGKKPKGMHWKTYRRKMAEIERLRQSGLDGAGLKFGSMMQEWM